MQGMTLWTFCGIPENPDLPTTETTVNGKATEKTDVIFEQSTEQLNTTEEGLANLLAYRVRILGHAAHREAKH